MKIEFYPYIKSQKIEEIEVSLEISKDDFEKLKNMSKLEQQEYIKTYGRVKITDFDIIYTVPEINEMDIYEDVN